MRGHEEARPVFVRMNRVADYFDELRDAGVRPRDFAHFVVRYIDAANDVGRGRTEGVDAVVTELRQGSPASASVHVLEAAAATKDHDHRAAQRALTQAVKKRPSDAGLAEMTRVATKLAGGADSDTGRQPATVAAVRLRAGDTLDGWALNEVLGAGGWGQVFRATRGAEVRALKVMHPDLAADPAFVGRFKQEIGALMRLPRHANLVAIDRDGFGYCADRRTWYLVMEHIDGPTLERYLAQKGPLSERQVRHVFAGVIEGLAAAHGAGIVHRDIKPGNLVFRRSDRRLVFVDFGLAVDVGDLGKTKVGGISELFASPEQHRGGSATKASDVFGLCAVMHYALTYDRPDDRLPDCYDEATAPASLRDVLARGLHRHPRQRLADAAALLESFGAKLAEPEANKEPVTPASLAIPVPGSTKGPKIGDSITNKVGMTFAWVPPGRSWLGGGKGMPGTSFALARGLWCGVYLVTQAEWAIVMNLETPSHHKGNPRCPVESVSWSHVNHFLHNLNEGLAGDGFLYRLPTEQEWEYICRGGPHSVQAQSAFDFYYARSKTDLTPAPTNDLDSSKANFDGNYPAGSAGKGSYLRKTCDVGLYLPNPLGLYDMHGNVWEWTSTLEGSSHVIRGGGWDNGGVYCTAAHRGLAPNVVSDSVGFRLLAVPTGG